MNITLDISPSEAQSIARVLNADHAGTGYDANDGDARDYVLIRLVFRAFLGGLRSRAIADVISRDYAHWCRIRRHRHAPRSHAPRSPRSHAQRSHVP